MTGPNSTTPTPEEVTIVENQHFVPKFYLQRFTNQVGLLERMNIESGEILSEPKSPKRECVVPFFYGQFTGELDEASQKIEKYWQDIENLIAPKINSIEEKVINYKELDEESLVILAVLGAMLWIRTPHLRETINANNERFEKELYKKLAREPGYMEKATQIRKKSGDIMNEDEAIKLQAILLNENYSVQVDNRMHLELIIDLRDFVDLFYAAKWRFLIATGKREFITTTNPCIEIFPKIPRAFGPSFYERRHLFPLSPKVMCEAIAPWIPGKRVKRIGVSDETVVIHNIQHAKHSYVPKHHSRCYSSRKEEFEVMHVYRKKH